MGGIFISYRRGDSSPYAGRLHDNLSRHFGEGNVFRDIDAISPGSDFVEVIEQSLGRCDAVIVLIGDDWLNITDSKGRRRLDNPDDFIRMEVEAALARGVPVIPVLVEDTIMPSAEELPESLAPLSRRNALQLSDSRFDYDFNRLVAALTEYLDKSPARVAGRGRRQPAPVVAMFVLIALAGVLVFIALRGDGVVTRTVAVPGDVAWTSTGIRLEPGQPVSVSAVGSVSHSPGSFAGPDGDPSVNPEFSIVAEFAHAALLGRVGTGEAFLIGSARDFDGGDGGELILGVNDSGTEGNGGSFEAVVEVGGP